MSDKFQDKVNIVILIYYNMILLSILLINEISHQQNYPI